MSDIGIDVGQELQVDIDVSFSTSGAVGGGGGPVSDMIARLEAAGAESGVVCCMGTANEWPFLRDYASVPSLADADFADTKGTARGERDAMFYDLDRSADGATSAALNRPGAVTTIDWVRIAPSATTPWGSLETTVSWGGSGESEPVNFGYAARYKDAGYTLEMFRETGAGSDRRIEFVVPNGFKIQTAYVPVAWTIDASGNARCYLGTHQLGWSFGGVGGVAGDLDGDVTGLVASGGTAGSFDANDLTGSLVAASIIMDVDLPSAPSEALRGGYDYTIPDALRSEAYVTALSAEAGCVMAFTGGSPTSSNAPVDVLGTVDATGGFFEDPAGTISESRCERFVGDRYVTTRTGSTYAPTFTGTVITGDLRVLCGVVYRSGAAFIVGNFATGESAPTDYPWSINFSGAAALRWFSEALAGRNIEIFWNLPETLIGGDVREIDLQREDNGDGTGTVRVWWTQPDGTRTRLSPSSFTAASPATAVADVDDGVRITNTTDGSSTQFGLSQDAPVRYCVVYDQLP